MIVLHSIIHTIQCPWNGNHGKLTRSGISGKFGFVVLNDAKLISQSTFGTWTTIKPHFVLS